MKILFRLIIVLAFATRQVQLNRLRELSSMISLLAHSFLEKIQEKLLKEEDVERVLRRLSRLTQEETQMAVVQNMEVVYGLISNIRVVMDGARSSSSWSTYALLNRYPFRQKGIYGRDFARSRYVRLYSTF